MCGFKTTLSILLVFLASCGPGKIEKAGSIGPAMPVARILSDAPPAALIVKAETDLDGKELQARQEVRTLDTKQLRAWNANSIRGFTDAPIVQLQSWRGRKDKQCLHNKCYGLYLDDVTKKVAASSTEAKFWYVAATGCTGYTYRAVRSGFGYKYFLFDKTESSQTCQQP